MQINMASELAEHSTELALSELVDRIFIQILMKNN